MKSVEGITITNRLNDYNLAKMVTDRAGYDRKFELVLP